jgi:hypothetical protein
VYVNDGKFQETVFFYPREVYFSNNRQAFVFDTTPLTDYTITARGGMLKLFARQGSAPYSIVGQVSFGAPASDEGNAGPVSVCEDDSGTQHAAWEDDGGPFQKIYYSKRAGGKWENPQAIVAVPFGATNPNITVDAAGTIYVVYEDRRNDFTDIGIVVKNRYGWSEPYTITSGLLDSLRPRVGTDSNKNVHVVWQDFRENTSKVMYMTREFSTGNWSEPLKISDGETPSIAIDGTDVYVAYKSSTSTITLARLQNGAVANSVAVTSSSTHVALPDLAVAGGYAHVVWQDGTTGNWEIYARRFNATTLVTTDPQAQITALSLGVGCQRPSIGARKGTGSAAGNFYLAWEFNATQIKGAVYNHSINFWMSSNQVHTVGMTTYGGFDVLFTFGDLRTMIYPSLPKVFAGDANVVYGAEVATTDEYLSGPDAFTSARDIVWDLTYAATVAVPGSRDLQISGQLARKEIRFGDFSQNISGNFRFGYFKLYTGDAVEPFDVAIAASGTTPILDDRAFCAKVNPNGDAWIGTEKGLSFYFRDSRELANVATFTSPIRALAFDHNGTMFVGTGNGLLYASYDHKTFSQITITGKADSSPVTDLAVAPDNTLWMATGGGGVYNIVTEPAVAPLSSSRPPSAAAATTYDLAAGLPSLMAFRIKVDDVGTVWICTDNGLVSITGNSLSVFNQRNSGIPSVRVNDIAIVSATKRFVATSAGLGEMNGTAISPVEIADPNWNGNVKSVAFASPNILWVGTMSYLFQIMLAPDEDTWTSYTPSQYTLSTLSLDDLRTFYIVGLDQDSVSSDSLIQVYVNNRIVLHGFTLASSSGHWAVQFDSPLNRDDVVIVLVRDDITKYATLRQNKAEEVAYGPVSRKVKKFVTDGTKLYAATSGTDQSLLRLDYSDAFLRPYDKIGLDTTPPTGTLTFGSQVDRHTVQLSVEDYGDNLSGLEFMKVSNFDNFTSDGVTPLPWIPFSPTIMHDLGTDLGLSSVQLTFTEGVGARIAPFTDSNGVTTLLATASHPARVYSFDPVKSQWTRVATLDLDINGNPNPNTSVQFAMTYNSKYIIGTQTDAGTGKVFVSTNGTDFNLLASVDGDAAYCATVFSNTLYIGTGPAGKIYSYNGTAMREVFAGMGSNIYSIAAYGPNLYLATGEQGRLYQWNPVTNTAIIINVDADTQLTAVIGCFVKPPVAISSGDSPATAEPSVVSVVAPAANQDDQNTAEGENVIFCGTGNTSKISKSDNLSPFITSYVTIAGSKVAFLRVMNDTGNGGVLYSAVNQSLLYYGDHVWLTKQGVTDKITDAFVDHSGTIWIVTESFIYQTKNDITKKNVYLKLRDRAGNETTVSDVSLQVSLQIDDLKNFTNQDRILELNEYGQTVKTFDGDVPFYSASRVEVESATYTSDVFNGTNEQVSWGTIYWDAVVPDGTTLKIGVRTSRSRVGLSSVAWTYYDQSEASGVDISNYTGQYIQFQAVMATTARGLSPALYKVVITSVIKASVHFFTTNFVLPSPIVSGIITSQKVVPVSADIVFGIDTNNSVDFADYQIVSENRVFTTGFDQAGKNLRVGVQLISPTIQPAKTDFYPEYDGYGSPQFINVVDFDFKAAVAGKKNFKVTFYNDSGLTDEAAVLSTKTSLVGWSANGAPFADGGIAMSAGETASIVCSIEGTSALRCNEYYWVKVEEVETSTTVSSHESFIAGCNTSFVDNIEFDFTNRKGSTKTFNFRVKIYADAARTEWVQTFFSGSNTVGWTADFSNIVEPGLVITNGQTVGIKFLPDVSALTVGKTYYLSVDSFDGTSFSKISKSWTFKTRPLSSGSCGEYTNVPVLKNFVIMFELADGSYIMLNT